MKNLVKAILSVMADVESIDKNTTVGEGKHSYSAVSDKDVKIAIGKAMQKHKLVMLPISIEPTVKVDRWEEDTYYNGNKGVKAKQSIFTEVNTKYLLMHDSGESIEISGYGHGVDSQDKSAGKATTYALKNALLYTFLVPTGSIDDADKTHSEDIETPNKTAKTTAAQTTGVTASLLKVIENCKDIDSLNTIWNNNKPLQENISFLKAITKRRADFATEVPALTDIFNSVSALHADSDFVSYFTNRRLAITEANKKQTA